MTRPGLLATLLFTLFAGCSTKPTVMLQRAAGGEADVRAEIASTPEARTLGLMFRKKLPSTEGMLFLFPEERVLTFWMKDTLIPLDMIFINSAMVVVGTVENATPLSTAPLSVSSPSKFVLEVNGGFVRQQGILPGAKVELRGIDPLEAR